MYTTQGAFSMPFDFPPMLRHHLVTMMANPSGYHVLPAPHHALSVLIGFSMTTYLTADGRVLMDDDDQPLHETHDPYLLHVTLIKAAERFHLPLLRTFVPACPPEGVVCPMCQGTQRLISDGQPLNIFCFPCQARGWIVPALQGAAATEGEVT
jgi:hypothetical protein